MISKRKPPTRRIDINIPTSTSPPLSPPSPLSLPPPPLNTSLSLVWDFGAAGCTGWGIEAMNFVIPLASRLPNIGVIVGDPCPGSPKDDEMVMTGLQLRRNSPTYEILASREPIDIWISHKPPTRFPRFPYRGLVTFEQRPRYVIGRSMLEVDSLPPEWVARSEEVDEIWAPTTFVERLFLQAGVPPEKVHLVPEPIDTALFDPAVTKVEPLPPCPVTPLALPIPGRTADTFVFLSVFKWETRKGWDLLVRAFVEEFGPHEDVALVMHTYLYGDADPRNRGKAERLLLRYLRDEGLVKEDDTPEAAIARDFPHAPLGPDPTDPGASLLGLPSVAMPRIVIHTDEVPVAQMPALYKAANAFVLPTRGEGFGLPIVEAMAMGLPAIVTAWSGPTDFLTSHTGYPLPIEGLRNATGREFRPEQRWAMPSITHLRRIMRAVFTNREQAAEIGRRARQAVVERFDRRVILEDVVLPRLALIGARLNSAPPAANGVHPPD
ncbi:putative glycosyltransferase [Paratrimastix pyriformis]|uniref:Glycosyltransferase n=1 Tax=Paratrimastix pyriformis TaxID=342808 RepID=A0ABQ8USS6_9EUKA|nr:putative glycosyltransferase [Paratrimastix pyriformis]